MRKITAIIAGMAAVIALSGAAQAQTILKASHQFPGGKGDVRDEMVQIIARDAKAANVGLDMQVYPGASLFKPNDQWNAMVNGQLDISSFPLDYASGKVPAFSATLMPGLVRSHDRAKRLNNSPFMKDIKAKIEKARRRRAGRCLARRRAWPPRRAASASRRTSRDRSFAPPVRPSPRCGRRPAPRIVSVAEQRSLQRAADRRGRCHRHQHRQLRVVPHLRAGRSASPRPATTRCGSCTSRC